MYLATEGDNDNKIMEENNDNNNNDEGASSASLNLSVSMSMSQDTATDTVTGKTVASTSIKSTDATIVRRGDGSFRVKDPIKKAHGKSHGDGNGNGIGGDMNIMHMNPLSRRTLLGTGAGNPGAGARTGMPSMPEEDTDGGTRTGTGTGRIKWCCGNLSWCPWKKRNELMWV